MRSLNVTWHRGEVGRKEREKLLGQKGACLWFTGLSGSGKSTLARALEKELYNAGRLAYVLDGDNIRHGLNGDLGFSAEERKENIRRIGEVARLFTDAGLITLTAFISPFRRDRDAVRSLMSPGDFVEIHVRCSLQECEKRDVKGLYARARKNEIDAFTGISSPYEPPLSPEITVDTEKISPQTCIAHIMAYLKEHHITEGS
jgi:adenylylsulfate kinase